MIMLEDYNTVRPHEALDYECPDDVYYSGLAAWDVMRHYTLKIFQSSFDKGAIISGCLVYGFF